MSEDLIADAIEEAFGPRCLDFDADCWCCKAWAQHAERDQLRIELDEQHERRAKAQAEVDRLHKLHASASEDRKAAIDEIERLRAKLAEAENVIEPFAQFINAAGDNFPDDAKMVHEISGTSVTGLHLRAAAKFMEQSR